MTAEKRPKHRKPDPRHKPARGERLSIRDLQDLWGVSRDLIDDLIRRGELPAIRVGRLWRVTREAAEAYERDHSTTAA